MSKRGTRPWFWHGSFENGVADLGYRELYTRWLQLAALLPIMRLHMVQILLVNRGSIGEEGTACCGTNR